MIITVFDTETTGLPKKWNANIFETHLYPHIIQLSFIVFDTNKNEFLDIKDNIVKISKDVELSEESVAIHKITRNIIDSKGIPFEHCIDKFLFWCEKSEMIIGHNVEFDFKMICVELLRLKEKFSKEFEKFQKHEKYFCTMKHTVDLCAVKAINKYGKEYNKFPKLIELHKHLFGIEPKNLHNALNDVVICLRCFYKLKFDKDLKEINDEMSFLLFNLI